MSDGRTTSILFLADGGSPHTVRLINELARLNFHVHLLSVQPFSSEILDSVKKVRVPDFGLLSYGLVGVVARFYARKWRISLVHAHYATGYGLALRISGRKNSILSVWGSDVYEFPYRSRLHLYFIKKNLLFPNYICVTSTCLLNQVSELVGDYNIRVFVTPFGVDLKAFLGVKSRLAHLDSVSSSFNIGTVKALTHVYGIDILIKAFAIFTRRLVPSEQERCSLHVYGDGEEFEELRSLAYSEGVSKAVMFMGRIPQKEVPSALATLDVFAALSRRESFGVAVVEAGAAGLPAVVSNVQGLPEIVINGHTGFIVPSESYEQAADVFERLYRNRTLRNEMGSRARCRVAELYDLQASIQNFVRLYDAVLNEE